MSCDWFYLAANSSSGGWILVAAVWSSGSWMQVTADSILRLTRVSAAGEELRLILSCGWLEFWRLDTSCGCLEFGQLDASYGWFHPKAGSGSGAWIGVAADFILRLTRVPAAEYELQLIPSHGWLKFRRLDTSCDWLRPTADLSSSGWIWNTADSILRLTQVLAAGCDLRLILSCDWLEFRWLDTNCSWFYAAANSSFIL